MSPPTREESRVDSREGESLTDVFAIIKRLQSSVDNLAVDTLAGLRDNRRAVAALRQVVVDQSQSENQLRESEANSQEHVQHVTFKTGPYEGSLDGGRATARDQDLMQSVLEQQTECSRVEDNVATTSITPCIIPVTQNSHTSNTHRGETVASSDITDSRIETTSTHAAAMAGKARRQSMFARQYIQQSRSFSEMDAGNMSSCMQTLTKIVRGNDGKPFDFCMGAVISANAIMTGVEIEENYTEGHVTEGVAVAEHIFLVIFVIEILMRSVTAPNWNECRSFWFMFDVFLVTLGAIVEWVLTPLVQAAVNSSMMTVLNQLLILRVFRLLRLARVLRLIEFFEELCRLTNGLINSAKTIMSACVFIVAMLYVFSCLGFDALSTSESLKADPVTESIVQRHFGSLRLSMLSLARFVLADSVHSIYEPIVFTNPMFIPFFLFVTLFISISLMNLVTAAIVNTAISQSNDDAMERRRGMRKMVKRLIPDIAKLFDDLDADKSGFLVAEELSDTFFDHVTIPKRLESILRHEKLSDLFEFLDMDGSGEVTREEFVDGVVHLVLQNQPFETSQTLQLLRSQQANIRDIRTLCEKVSRHLGVTITESGESPRSTPRPSLR
jgi:hypothetical protein